LSPWEKIHVITDRVIYTQPLFKLIKIVNTTSLPGIQIRKPMHHPASFGKGHQSVYLVLYVAETHKIFVNRGINRCMLVK